jgi:hypothetical protein
MAVCALPAAAQTSMPPSRARESLSWEEVRHLSPGQDVLVTLKDGSARRRCFVEADEAQLTVLNLDAATLSSSTRRLLRQFVATPGHWAIIQKGSTVQLDNGTRVTASAVVSRSGQQLANLPQITERIARTELVLSVEPDSRWGLAVPYSAGIVGGASPRGGQAGIRMNVGLGPLVSLDLGAEYWGWSHFRDQDHLVVARAQVRIGPREKSGWRPVGIVGGTIALNTEGYTPTAGLGLEREYGTRRVSVDVGLSMFTFFANVSVLFGPRR